MRKIEDHAVLVHGAEHEQFFKGCGVSFTKFTDVATGIGNDAAEAFEDALECLAQGDWETEDSDSWEDKPSADASRLPECECEEHLDCSDCEDDCEGCTSESVHVYVSVRVTDVRETLYDFAHSDFQQQLEELLELTETSAAWTKISYQLSRFSKVPGFKAQPESEAIATRKILEECKCLSANAAHSKARECEQKYHRARDEFELVWGRKLEDSDA